jgi:hypothetical protein
MRALAWVFLTAAACTSSPAGNGAIPAHDDFCELLAAAACDGFVSCCTASGLPADGRRCTSTWVAICQDEFRVKPGTAYDPVAGAACVAQLRVNAGRCGSVKSEACDDVIVGALPIGADCAHGGKCASSAAHPARCLPLFEPGVCTALAVVGEGESCAAPEVTCKPELRCDFGGTRTCMPYVARGQTCRSFVSPGECAAALVCDSLTNTCVDRGGNGTPCASSSRCVEGLFCASSGTCEKPRPLGSACVGDDDCLSRSCLMGRCAGPDATFCQDFNPFHGGT